MRSLGDERMPFHIVFDAGRGTNEGDVPADGSVTRLVRRVPLDMIVYGIYGEVLDQDGNDTLGFSINIRDSRDQQWWYHTRPNPGDYAPAALVMGTTSEPFIWPEPRLLRRGSTVELFVKSGGADVSLCHLRIVLIGARLKIDGQGRLKDELMAYDRKDRGYGALIVSSPDLAPSPELCIPGDPQTDAYHLGSMPYDLVFSQASLISYNPAGNIYEPLTEVRGELSIHDIGKSHFLIANQRFLPYSFFGGSTKQAGAQSLAVRPISTDIGAAWRIRQDNSLSLTWRTLISAINPYRVWMAFHGYRSTPVGRIATTKDMSTAPCAELGNEALIERSYPFGGF